MSVPEPVGEPAHGITVAVIVATFNRADFLPAALDSIFTQTRPPDQVIVVDDGSTDDTANVLSGYADRLTVLCKTNGGKSSALNLGLQYVSSTHVWLCDDDDIAWASALENHIQFLENNKDFDFTYGSRYFFKGAFSQETLEQEPPPYLPKISAQAFLPWVVEQLRVSLSSFLVPLACYREVGGFDETLFRSQDHDMIIRLARRFRAGRVNSPTLAIRVHGGLRGPSFARHSGRSRASGWRVFQKTIYRRVRDELTLREYLDCAGGNQTLTSELTRCALVRRGYAMVNHGLYSEGLDDLAAGIVSNLLTPSFPTRDEQRVLSQFTVVDNIQRIAPTRFYAHLGGMARRNRRARKWFGRGLYWSYVRHAKRPFVLVRVVWLTVSFSVGYFFPIIKHA